MGDGPSAQWIGETYKHLGTIAREIHDVAEAERIAGEVEQQALAIDRFDLLAGSTWVRAMCALTREEGEAAETLLHRCLLELERADRRLPPFLPVVTPCVSRALMLTSSVASQRKFAKMFCRS